jgi:hypothetical protein
MDIYRQASREGLRFQTNKGVLAVEQLWDLSQKDLAECIKLSKKNINKDATDDEDLSFLDNKVVSNPTEQLRFDILKDVFVSKQTEAQTNTDIKTKRDYNQRLLMLIADKKEEDLKGKSIEELEAMMKT